MRHLMNIVDTNFGSYYVSTNNMCGCYIETMIFNNILI